MMIKYRNNNKAKTVLRSFRIPIELDHRITELAIKNLITRSSWIVKTLEQKAYKHIHNPVTGSDYPVLLHKASAIDSSASNEEEL